MFLYLSFERQEWSPSRSFTFLSRLYTNGDYEVLVRALQMYTPFHGGATPTEKQLEKFWNALLHPEPADVLHVEWLMGLSGDLDRFLSIRSFYVTRSKV